MMTAYNFQPGFNGLPSGEQLNAQVVVNLVTVSLTNWQLLHLHTNPVTMLPPPGPGKAYIIINSVYQSIGGNANFDSTDTGPGCYYGMPILGGQNIADGGNQNSPFAPQFCIVQPPPNLTGLNIQASGSTASLNEWVDNAPIILINVNANMTGGGGAPGRVSLLYYVLDVG